VLKWARITSPFYFAVVVLGQTHNYTAALTTLAMGVILLLTESKK